MDKDDDDISDTENGLDVTEDDGNNSDDGDDKGTEIFLKHETVLL